MERFIECARTGANRSASTGEAACFKLARRVREISDLLADVDAGLKEEFFEILRAAAWPDTREGILRIINRIVSQ